MARIESTYDKVLAAKASQGKVVIISRQTTIHIDRRISDSFTKSHKNKDYGK